MCFLFDTFIEHRSLVAPMPFKNVPMSEENISMLVHNKQIFFASVKVTQRRKSILWTRRLVMLEGGVLTSTNFGPRPPSFIISLMQALCPPLSPSRIATLQKRRNINCGSITSWSFNCFIPCFVSTLEMTKNSHFQTLITTSLLWKSMKQTSRPTLFIMVTYPIMLGCGRERIDVQNST